MGKLTDTLNTPPLTGPLCPVTAHECGRLDCDPARNECAGYAREPTTPTMWDKETVNGLPVCKGATLTSSPSRPMIPAGEPDLQMVLDRIIYDVGATIESRADAVLALIGDEVKRALAKHPPITDSPHHHYGVLMEEVREFETEVFTDNIRLAREEVLQVAAMAIRFVLEADLPKHKRKPSEAPKPRPNCPRCGSHPPYHRNACDQSWVSGEPARAVPTSSIPGGES